jgi:hypothetical protein
MKKINEHIIDRISRELLENHSVEAPNGAFHAIKRELNLHTQEKRKRTILYIAASWVVLLSFGLGYFTRTLHLPKSELTAVHMQQKNIDKKSMPNAIIATTVTDKSQQSKTKGTKTIRNESPLTKNTISNTRNELTSNENTFVSQLIKTESLNQKLDSNTKVLSHNDSLKLMYKYISLSSGMAKDSALNNTIALAYQNPIFPIEEPTSKRNWSITGGVTPMMGFNMTGNNAQSQEASQLKVNIISSEQKPEVTVKNTSVSYSTGIAIKTAISEKWNMRAGMNYNTITESNSNVNYIEVPLMCEYRLINRTLKLFFTNGLGAGFKQADIYPLGMSGFSFLYPLSKKVDFNLEPTYKHMFGKTWSYKADYYGMMAGLSVKF